MKGFGVSTQEECDEAAMKFVGRVVGITISVAMGLAIVSMWAALDTSYLDIPAASMTERARWAWEIAVGWRLVVTLLVGSMLYGAWTSTRPR
jgi:hypothetical protein